MLLMVICCFFYHLLILFCIFFPCFLSSTILSFSPSLFSPCLLCLFFPFNFLCHVLVVSIKVNPYIFFPDLLSLLLPMASYSLMTLLLCKFLIYCVFCFPCLFQLPLLPYFVVACPLYRSVFLFTSLIIILIPCFVLLMLCSCAICPTLFSFDQLRIALSICHSGVTFLPAFGLACSISLLGPLNFYPLLYSWSLEPWPYSLLCSPK